MKRYIDNDLKKPKQQPTPPKKTQNKTQQNKV